MPESINTIMVLGAPGSGKTYFIKKILSPRLKLAKIKFENHDVLDVLKTKYKINTDRNFPDNIDLDFAYSKLIDNAKRHSRKIFYIYEFATDKGFSNLINSWLQNLDKESVPLVIFLDFKKELCIKRNNERIDNIVQAKYIKEYFSYQRKREKLLLKKKLGGKMLIVADDNTGTLYALADAIVNNL